MRPEQLAIQVIAELLDLDEASLSPDLPLCAIEGWDSVNALRVLVYLERELGCPLDYDRFARASCIAELVCPNQSAATGAAP